MIFGVMVSPGWGELLMLLGVMGLVASGAGCWSFSEPAQASTSGLAEYKEVNQGEQIAEWCRVMQSTVFAQGSTPQREMNRALVWFLMPSWIRHAGTTCKWPATRRNTVAWSWMIERSYLEVNARVQDTVQKHLGKAASPGPLPPLKKKKRRPTASTASVNLSTSPRPCRCPPARTESYRNDHTEINAAIPVKTCQNLKFSRL